MTTQQSDEIQEVKRDLQEVSYAVLEATNERTAQREKRFFIIIIMLIALLVVTNVGWVVYEMSMETVEETTVAIDGVTQTTDAAENNFYSIVGGGAVGDAKN